MAQHEDKHCPRCGDDFECKVGSILQCQCSNIAFTEQERDYIRITYADCLCHQCLQIIKHEINTNITQQKMQIILASIKKK